MADFLEPGPTWGRGIVERAEGILSNRERFNAKMPAEDRELFGVLAGLLPLAKMGLASVDKAEDPKSELNQIRGEIDRQLGRPPREGTEIPQTPGDAERLADAVGAMSQSRTMILNADMDFDVSDEQFQDAVTAAARLLGSALARIGPVMAKVGGPAASDLAKTFKAKPDCCEPDLWSRIVTAGVASFTVAYVVAIIFGVVAFSVYAGKWLAER